MITKRPLKELLRLEIDEVWVKPNGSYRIAGVYGKGRGTFERREIAGSETSYRTLNRLHSGQLVLSRLKAFEGAIAVVPSSLDGWYLSPEFPTFECIEGELEPGYLSHVCRWPEFWTILAATSKGIGARRERVHVADFLQICLAVPGLDRQRDVQRYLDKIVNTACRSGLLLDRASALSNALAVSVAARPDLDDGQKIAAGWRRVVLGDLMTASKGQIVVKADREYRIAGIFSFGRGLIDRGSILGAETSYNTMTTLDKGDVVASKLNGWEGAVAVVDERFAGYCVSPEYPTFKVDEQVLLPGYFQGIARSPRFWEALNANARGSMVRRRRINSAEFLGTEIWLPSLRTQAVVAAQLVALDQAAAVRSAAATRIAALIPAALNDAFSGVT